MPSREPQVSVCIPTYNRAGLLGESIASVLAQTFRDFELIISDNASEDATESVVRSFGDGRIKYTRNAKNFGHRENMNRCLMLSKGRYIAILPDDDMMVPDNLAAKVAVLTANPEVGLVHSKYHIVDDAGQVIRYNTNWGHGPDRISDVLERRQDTLLSMYNPINMPTVLLRRACYERLGGFTDRTGLAFDYEYWMRIAVYYEVAFVAKPLVKWRIHAGTLTNIHLGAEESQKLKQVLAVKRLILKKHSHAIPEDLKKQMYRQVSASVAAHGEALLGNGGPNPKVTALIAEMCCTFPEILRDKDLWKVLLKSGMSRRNIDRLKQLSSNLKSYVA